MAATPRGPGTKMAGNAVTQLLEGRGSPVEQRPLVRGYVSTLRPAPTGFPTPGSEANLLWVVAPGYSTDRPLGPCWWSAENGTALPAQGDPVVVGFDDQGVPTVVSWVAPYSPGPALVAALPTEPVDGQEVYFQSPAMAELGAIWHLRFRAGAPFAEKWEYVGGGPLWSALMGAISGKTSLTEEALTSGPSLTVPLSGHYWLQTYMSAQTQATGLQENLAQLGINGVAGGNAVYKSTVNQTFEGALTTTSIPVNLKSGDVLTVRVRQVTAVSSAYGPARLILTPVTVG